MLEEFKLELKERLNQSLPASDAHQKVMRHRKPIDQLGDLPDKARKSAVLLLIYPKAGELYTVFIKRPVYKGVHSGQIAFPGGKVEKLDKDLKSTAFREAEEELNITTEKNELLGELTPFYIPPSNFIIHPFIAFQRQQPNFISDPIEVASYVECPINYIREDNLKELTVHAQDKRLKVKGFEFKQHVIWGATAMILMEFAEILDTIKLPTGLK